MKTIENLLKEHHFFSDLEQEYIETIAGCGSNIVFEKDTYIAREGEEANQFFLVKTGKIAIDILEPKHGPIIIQTVQEGDIFGWSWIIAPHYWRFDARALETTHAIALDGKCLREKCEEDNKLGYQLLKRFSGVLAKRLEMARMQLLDIYGNGLNKEKDHA